MQLEPTTGGLRRWACGGAWVWRRCFAPGARNPRCTDGARHAISHRGGFRRSGSERQSTQRAEPCRSGARPSRRSRVVGDELPRRALPARRQLGARRLRLQRLHAPRLRADAWASCCRGASTSRPALGPVAGQARRAASRATWCSSTRSSARSRTWASTWVTAGSSTRRAPARACASRTCDTPTGPSATPVRAARYSDQTLRRRRCRQLHRTTRERDPASSRRRNRALSVKNPAVAGLRRQSAHNSAVTERVIPLADQRYRGRGADASLRRRDRPTAC